MNDVAYRIGVLQNCAESGDLVSVTLIWYLSRYFAIVCRFSLFF